MRILIIISLCLLLNPLNAQIITDRPDQTESSSTVGKGNLQIESGFLIGFEGEDLSTRQILAPTTLMRYGITKGFELRFVSQFESFKILDKSFQGISDLEIGTKIQIFQKEDVNTEIAFLSHLVVPTGSPEISADVFGTVNKLSISHSLNDNIGLGYNLGYDYMSEGIGSLTYSLAFGFGVNKKVGIYAEPYGAWNDFEDFIVNFDAGFTYLANQNLQFDFSFGTGLNQKMNYISIGASWLLLNNSSKE